MADPNTETTTVGLGGGSPNSVGTDADSLVGFHGDAVVQASTIASVSTSQPIATTVDSTAVFGFYSSAQFNSLIAAVNSVLTALQNKGIIA